MAREGKSALMLGGARLGGLVAALAALSEWTQASPVVWTYSERA